PPRLGGQRQHLGQLRVALKEIGMGLQVGDDVVGGDDLDLSARTVGRRDRAVAAHMPAPRQRVDRPVLVRSSRKAFRPFGVNGTLTILATSAVSTKNFI